MGFKTGKGNVVSQQKAEIARLKQEIDDLKFRPHLDAFIKEMGKTILMFLAMTKYSEWPEIAKISFEHHAKKAPTSAYFYKERLPK